MPERLGGTSPQEVCPMARINAPAESSFMVSFEYDGGRLHVTVHDGETRNGPVVARRDFPDSVDSMVAATWCIERLESIHEARHAAEAR